MNKEKIFDLIIERVDEKITEKDKVIIKELFYKICVEVAENEYVSIDEIKKIGVATHSVVLSLGNKIIKFGGERHGFEVPNHPRILQPIIRVDLSKISNFLGCIEVTEKVDTDINIDLNTLYKIYSEFRKDGLYPIDLKKENIGRLIKDNIIYGTKA